MATTKPKAPKMTPEERAAAKRAAFLRLAAKRVNRALNALRIVGHLAGPGYAYSEEEASRIVAVLTDAVSDVAARFSGRSKPEFTL